VQKGVGVGVGCGHASNHRGAAPVARAGSKP
jgi:hypothetical protein